MVTANTVAHTWRRVVAFFIDHLIILGFFIPLWIQVLGSWFQGEALEIDWRLLIMCFLLQFLYRWVFLVFMGATLGQLLLGLRVVNFQNGQTLGWLQSFIRVLADHFSFFFAQAFYVIAIFRFDRRHLSDWLAGTQVRQFAPRTDVPKPHVVLGSICFCYFFATGFFSAYRLMQKVEWDGQNLIVQPSGDVQDGPESGYD